jgi:hypothetical protein
MAKFSDELVRAALAGRLAVSRYPFPGNPAIEVGVKLLTDTELDAVRLQAVVFAKSKNVDATLDPEFIDRAIHRETISRAFVDPDKPDEPFFASQHEVAQLDNLSVRSLHELYLAHHQSMDPLAFCPAEEVGALVEQLGKSESSAGILSLYDLPTLRSLVLSMALLLRETRQTLKSSTS